MVLVFEAVLGFLVVLLWFLVVGYFWVGFAGLVRLILVLML